jgi:hypothetical protein
MLRIKNTKFALVLPALILGILFATAPAPVYAEIPGCDTGAPDVRESCEERYIENEIRRRCTTGGDAAIESCSRETRESIQNGDLDYDGSSDEFSPGNYEGDCKEEANLNRDNCGIIAYIVDFTRILSGLVGIVVVIMITVGGIQYAAAGPDPSAVVAARKRISNALIALVLYIFMFAFLQWLVPGGIF